MSTIKLTINAPFFPGYYESNLYNSDTEYWAEKYELDYFADVKNCSVKDVEDFLKSKNFTLDFDFARYTKEINDNYILSCQGKLKNIFTNCKFLFSNFRGACLDVLECNLIINKDELNQLVKDNKANFEKHLQNKIFEDRRVICIYELEDNILEWNDEEIQSFIEFLLTENDCWVEDKILQDALCDVYAGDFLNYPADLYDYDIPLQECKVDSNN